MSATSPVVSIITPCFNRADTLPEMLDSLLAQTFPSWECVIVDDGSTDSSEQVIRRYAQQDRRIRLLHRDREPKGACTSRNIAVQNSRGQYLIFFDTDDVLADYCLTQRVNRMDQHPQLDFGIFSMLFFQDHVGDSDLLWNIDTGEDDLTRLLRIDPVCQGTGTLWRKESFVRLGMWNENLALWQDVDLHLRALILGYKYDKFLHLPPDVYIRKCAGSLSRSGYNSRRKLESREQVIRDAIKNLIETGQTQYLRDARFICAEIVLAAAENHHFRLARGLSSWATDCGVFTAAEKQDLNRIALLRQLRATKLAFVRGWCDRWERPFRGTSSLGAVRYQGRAA